MTNASARALLAVLLCMATVGAHAQTYRNVVNNRFGTVANGPMQALVVDVPNGSDAAHTWSTVATRVVRARRARSSSLQRQMAALRKVFPKKRLTLGFPDIVVLRQNGRVIRSQATRSVRATQDITFDLPTSGDGSWTTAQATELSSVINIIYPVLKSVYGDPSWSGTVTIVNGDNTSPIIGDPDALSGGVYNISTKQIVFAEYNSEQTRVLNLTQMMALAFRGDASISFDAWERGMARAATILTVSTAMTQLEALYGSGTIDVTDPLWNALDRYDLLNQSPLGNDRFYPISAADGVANETTFPNMVIPRLMMAGTAWLKVLTEDPSFLVTFNAAYYTALATDSSVARNIPSLRGLALQALTTDGVSLVEGLTFQSWYEQQYTLDTSVTQGEKLYALVSALRPASSAADDYAIGIVLYYYRTTDDDSGNSVETNLNGTIYPIYWDYTYVDRLYLASQYESVAITAGLGTVAPTFFDTIGGDSAYAGRMRVTIELPINGQVVRLHVAPRSMGITGAANTFWGTVVGADTGTMQIVTESGVNTSVNVVQGAFGAALDASAFSRRGRTTLTFTPSSGSTAVTRKVITGPGEFNCVFYAQDNIGSITQTLPKGLFMASFPIKPSRTKATDALLDPITGNPLFTDDTLLMAHWRQNSTGTDKYELYPEMEPIQLGSGYWLNLSADTKMTLTGTVLKNEPYYSVGLSYGWNQIGNPFQSDIDISKLQFQHLADNIPATLAEAIANGWIDATSSVSTTTATGFWKYTSANGYQPASALEPWFGYWIRVLVSEGVTITFPNPNVSVSSSSASAKATRSTSRSTSNKSSSVIKWSVPMRLASSGGAGATAVLGQADAATATYDRAYDALLPPSPVGTAPALAFSHTDWSDNAGDYYSDIRNSTSSASWTLTAKTPAPNTTYTLTWGNLTSVPRSVRLVLNDLATGRRQYMQTSSGYSFSQTSSGTRRFRIDVERHGASALRITGLSARASRSAGSRSVTVGFSLSQGATIDARIHSANGHTIRTLTSGRAAASGSNALMWDTKTDSGISVPTGAYLIEVSAKTTDGDAVRVILPVTVVR